MYQLRRSRANACDEGQLELVMVDTQEERVPSSMFLFVQ